LKPFEVIEEETSKGQYVALILRGYLDAHTVNDFEAYMDRSIEHGTVRYLVDISELNYMSSAGIGAIMSLTQRLRRSDGDLVLLRPTEKVFKILDKLGFTRIFRFAYSQEEAERYLNS
jgi:anti-anti-sigma factor